MRLTHWLVLVVVIALVAGLIWYQSQDVRLSEAPPRSAANVDLPERTSALQLRLAIPYDALEQAANRVLPGQMKFSGHGKNACVDAGLLGKHCAGTKYSATIQREGNFKVHSRGGNLAASLVISVRGKGGLRGSGAKLVKVDKKNFHAKARIHAVLDLELTDDWCPDVGAKLSYEWLDKPRVEIVHKVWVNVENQVGQHVDKALKNLATQIEAAIPCEPVQKAVAEMWTPRSIPLNLHGTELFANVSPRSLGLSEVQVGQETVQLVLAAEAVTEISTTSLKTESIPALPPKTAPGAETPSQLDVALALRAGYETLDDQLEANLGGRSFRVETPQGPAVVELAEFEIYPTGDRVAMGVRFGADIPGHFLDVRGEVFVTAKPRPTADGLGLELQDVSISRRLDHELWEVLSAIFEQKLIQGIETAGKVQLGPAWQEAEAMLQEQLAANTKGTGLELKMGAGTARILNIVPEDEHLSAIVDISLPLSATLREIPLGQGA